MTSGQTQLSSNPQRTLTANGILLFKQMHLSPFKYKTNCISGNLVKK